MKDKEHFYTLCGSIMVTIGFAALAWFAWTYLGVGYTFFVDWLPHKWLDIGFLHMLGLTILLSLTLRIVRSVRWAIMHS